LVFDGCYGHSLVVSEVERNFSAIGYHGHSGKANALRELDKRVLVRQRIDDKDGKGGGQRELSIVLDMRDEFDYLGLGNSNDGHGCSGVVFNLDRGVVIETSVFVVG
jgi:stalled ribosome alternative rescue factor ArfA